MVSKLKGYRNMAGYTQEDMSKLINVSRPGFNMKENGILKFTEQEETIVFEALHERIPDLKKEDVFPVLEE